MLHLGDLWLAKDVNDAKLDRPGSALVGKRSLLLNLDLLGNLHFQDPN
jgi:hypothetical protein